MNLGQYIAQQLLEAENTTIALFPGAFKPPHKGHFAAVKKLLEQADQVVVLISPKTREGVTADESVAIWELYKTLLDGSVEIRVAGESPVKEAYRVAESNPDTNFILASGKGEDERFKTAISKLPNTKSVDVGNFEGTNATDLRVALQANNEDAIKQYIPDDINIADFLMALSKKPKVNTDATPVDVELQEINHQTTDDTFAEYVATEESEIERTAEEFNLPIPDVRYAFQAGNMVVLSDDIWSKLENSDSYDINSLEDAIKLATGYNKDFNSILDAIKADKTIDPPMVLNYDKDKYYLVGGNTRLMFYKALGKTPKVLMGTLDLEGPKPFPLAEVKRLNESETGTIGEFIKFAIKNLAIQNPPRNLSLSYDTNKAKEMRSFGYFNPNDNKIWVYCGNRNMADILRTLAHELVHRKQDEEGRISYESGKTGSDIENEANAKAGVLLRDFGKQHEEIYQ
jgi:cytidyltransferase-like protein